MASERSSSSGPWTVKKAIPRNKLRFSETSPIWFFHILGNLKITKRAGWRLRGIEHGESIADHSHRMAMMGLLAPPHIDKQKCVMMCLVHDIAESLVGDLTPMDGVPREEKSRRESLVFEYFTEILGEHGKHLQELWLEFEAGETLESRFAQDLDKIELLLQLVEYEDRGKGDVDLGEMARVRKMIKTLECKVWAAEILDAREKFWGHRKHKRGEHGMDGGMSTEYARLQDKYYGEEEET